VQEEAVKQLKASTESANGLHERPGTITKKDTNAK
jgi:hypothetical protein